MTKFIEKMIEADLPYGFECDVVDRKGMKELWIYKAGEVEGGMIGKFDNDAFGEWCKSVSCAKRIRDYVTGVR